MASETTKKIKKDREGTPIFKYSLLFILFLAIGIVLGIFGALKYIEYRNSQESDKPLVSDEPEDITKKEDYKELITNLTAILDANPLFYNSNGINISSLDNATKLTLIYNRLVKEGQGTNEEIESLWYGSTNCVNDFVTDPTDNGYSSNKCTVTKFQKSAFLEISKKLFNDALVAMDGNFNPSSSKLCVPDGEDYVCGNVYDASGVTGSLESKFTVVKALRLDDGTIEIYEKGYLVDKRSNVLASGVAENYYLHSSDSDSYYYELRNADNLTFKHTFKTEDKKNYYYVSTVLYKE
jgi:hypothetical protein